MVKVGIVGLGFIGKRHYEILQKDDKRFDLQAVCDIDEKALGFVSDNIPQFTSFEAFLEVDLDLVAICTPNAFHADQSIQSLIFGKNVICEKPLAISANDALQMINVAKNTGKHLFCMLQNRMSPVIQWLSQVIHSGICGKIFYVQVNCFWNRDVRYYKENNWKGSLSLDGGSIYTQFSHFTDVLILLFGHLNHIDYARFWDFNHQFLTEFEDSGTVLMELQNQVQVQFNYSTSCFQSNLESSITIIAEKGMIKIGGQYMNEVLECKIENYEMPKLEPMPPPNSYPGYQGSASNHHLVYQNVYNVLTQNRQPYASIIDAFYSVSLIEQVYQIRNEVFRKSR